MAAQNTEYLIIGSGVAAAALSQKILSSRPNASILILEAGSKTPMKEFRLYQEYLTTGVLPYNYSEDYPFPSFGAAGENISVPGNQMKLAGGRTMMYGGSTVHWGGWAFRLKPEDFRLYSNTHREGTIDWPIDYDELEPFYCEAEAYIGVSGSGECSVVRRSKPYPFPHFPYTLEDQPFLEAYSALNYQFNPLPIARHGITDTDSKHAPCKTTGTCKYCPFGARYVAANFLDDMLEYGPYPNLKVVTNAIVDSISMASKKVAKGATYHQRFCSEVYEVHADKVIVAAGAIETAKLLQRSISEFWEDGVGNTPKNNLVGKNFVSHPFIFWNATVPNNPLALQPEMNFPTLVSRQFDTVNEQMEGKWITVHLPSSPSLDANTNHTVTDLQSAMRAGIRPEEITQLLSGKLTVQLITQVEVFTQETNYVENSNLINHLGMRETKVNFVPDSSFQGHVEHIQKKLTPVFDKIGATDLQMAYDSIRADHASCTTRMSDGPDTGVVDKNLLVFETENLYVLSNGAFSSLSAVNPTLTLTALAMRLGNHLLSL